ncbi:AlpA family transcriptional regulator [Noviherbaspirillum sp. UKPF54]|uniref:helix-turn-helix transcriptional regulator n=1 Tax=Noviherbaspirillum sp. UKPF54 TaxID=2601898 RepID=UPI0011B16AFB|nr:helix-turn-helix domain-containing protein [Noviherbaspirillum sp. UKPF54]QDZ29062.1 helix-turn-helix domain-containing protein [Noviherbaspirillum sp. UKPF54]
MDPQSTFLSTAEVLDLLKCSKTALRNLIKFDCFPRPLKFSFGGKGPSRTTAARYPKAEVEAWIRDKAIEAQSRRNQYVAAYPPIQLCKIADIDSALFYMRGVLDVYDERKRVFGKVRSDLSLVAPQDLPWGEIKAGIMEMLMQVMQAASAVGIDVEGMVKS